MTSRRTDAMYFGLILVVVLVVYYASTRSSDEELGPLEIPSFSAYFEPPAIALPEPGFVFRPLSTYKVPRVDRPRFADDMETALLEVRSELLATAIPTEIAMTD